MKKWVLAWMFFAISLCSLPALADSPIYTGWMWDSAPAAAYNSKNGEFLVVWNMYNYLYPTSDERFYGPLMGQLIKESGAMIGPPFEIIHSGGVLPDVVYNSARNEYLVVAERWNNTVGQRVSALGLVIGGPTILLTNARFPKAAYNSLAQNYLVIGAWPTGSGDCDIQIYSRQVNGNGQPLGSASVVALVSSEPCEYSRRYAIAYAPVVSANTPQGRYLLARIVMDGLSLSMLNSQGQAMNTVCNYGPVNCEATIPFQNTLVGRALNIDMAYGLINESPVFFLVWGDTDNEASGQHWSGIWGGIVNAEKEMYYKEEQVQNDVFPISYQYSHYSTDEYANEWHPAVDYNAAADRFVVVWRETPGTDPRDPTTVNHIRANTSDGYRLPPLQNLIISSTGGTENPKMPCVAASTATNACLTAWEDHRNLFGIGDIYGSFLNASTRTPSGIQPPEPDSGKKYWKAVSGGSDHTLGLYYAGAPSGADLMAWGDNFYGQLGLGVGDTTDRHTPTQVGSYSDWVSIAAGLYSLGIRSDGALWAWGYNYYGQLGLGVGDTTDRHIPTQVGSYSDWTSISGGGWHSLGIRSDGTLWAWGYNHYGQLGLGVGDTTDRHIPTQVGSYSDWVSISGGDWHSLGIRSDGTLWTWGDNFYGQLGLGVGDTTDRHTPTQVGSYSDWVSIAAGRWYSLGIRSDGTLWAWGHNFFGQLGLGVGDTTDRHIPTQVGSYSDWISIAAGFYHSLSIRSDGTLWAWGYNHYGQLGLGVGDTTDRHIPTRVGPYSDWVSTTAGSLHSLGIHSDGSLWAWGGNFDGRLGLEDTINRHIPTPVAPFPPCPECATNPVVLTNVTFPAGRACECRAATSITVGNGTIVKNEATVHFISPQVKVQSGAKFESGAVVRIKQ